MAKWMIAAKKADFDKIANKFHINKITARLLRNRDLISDTDIDMYLNGDISAMHNPYDLKDIERAADIIADGIKSNKKIRIIGDYDVDGICSTYILFLGMSRLGACVDYKLPDRIKDGYGLNDRLVYEALDDKVDILITCDNGIAASSQIELAKKSGITVIVTDHHEVPIDIDTKMQILPMADAVVDPKRSDDNSTFKEICGAVVAFKFIKVLYDKFDDNSIFYGSDTNNNNQNVRSIDEIKNNKKAIFYELLEFAALATVCDVMPLVDENRIIVREGLKRINNSKNLGLRSLINVNSISDKDITTYHLGFVIGPCLNATGRLQSAMRGMELLTSQNEVDAMNLATDLKAINDSRKTMTKNGVEEAANQFKDMDALPKVIVIYLENLHESIAGIVAGKIREKYERPSIVLTKAIDGVKGSGRSIENYDMFENLSMCKDLFTKFGGHKMAAGLSLPLENVDTLRERLNDACTLSEEDFVEVKHVDMELAPSCLNIPIVKEFSLLEPFGNGNSKPQFAARAIKIIDGKIMGKNKNCAKYTISDQLGNKMEMVYFGDMEKWHDFLSKRYGNDIMDKIYNNKEHENVEIKILYYPDINSWRGIDKLQIVMTDFCY